MFDGGAEDLEARLEFGHGIGFFAEMIEHVIPAFGGNAGHGPVLQRFPIIGDGPRRQEGGSQQGKTQAIHNAVPSAVTSTTALRCPNPWAGTPERRGR